MTPIGLALSTHFILSCSYHLYYIIMNTCTAKSFPFFFLKHYRACIHWQIRTGSCCRDILVGTFFHIKDRDTPSYCLSNGSLRGILWLKKWRKWLKKKQHFTYMWWCIVRMLKSEKLTILSHAAHVSNVLSTFIRLINILCTNDIKSTYTFVKFQICTIQKYYQAKIAYFVLNNLFWYV